MKDKNSFTSTEYSFGKESSSAASNSATSLKLIEPFHQNLEITSNRSKVQLCNPTAGRIRADIQAMTTTTIIIELIGDRRISPQLTLRLPETWARTRIRHNKMNKSRERTHPTNETHLGVENQTSNNRCTPMKPPDPTPNSREGTISLSTSERIAITAQDHIGWEHFIRRRVAQ